MLSALTSRLCSRAASLTWQPARYIHTPPPIAKRVHPFMQFFANARSNRTGRAWSVPELRTKSSEDLEKLWFVILKERNVLATYENYCRQSRVVMRNRDRIVKCRRSHAAIKFVLNERRLAWKKLIHDNKFLGLQKKKTERRYFERLEKNFAKRRPKTPNQHRNVNIQDKTWRRKTMGKTYLGSVKPRSSAPAVPPSASV